MCFLAAQMVCEQIVEGQVLLALKVLGPDEVFFRLVVLAHKAGGAYDRVGSGALEQVLLYLAEKFGLVYGVV